MPSTVHKSRLSEKFVLEIFSNILSELGNEPRNSLAVALSTTRPNELRFLPNPRIEFRTSSGVYDSEINEAVLESTVSGFNLKRKYKNYFTYRLLQLNIHNNRIIIIISKHIIQIVLKAVRLYM